MESLSVATLYADVFDDEEIGFATGALPPITTVSGEDPLLCDFPELNPFEIDEYIDVDGVPRYDPYEDKVVGLSEVRRRSELKRLNNNGWEREEREDKACNKRRRWGTIDSDTETLFQAQSYVWKERVTRGGRSWASAHTSW